MEDRTVGPDRKLKSRSLVHVTFSMDSFLMNPFMLGLFSVSSS